MGHPTPGVAAKPRIVVIGASAGGIEPLIAIAADLPPDLDAAVFVVVHMPASGRSVLPRVLSRAGPLMARHARERELIRRGRIYVAPPDRHLVIEDGVVHTIRGPLENRMRPAIDPLFRSAATAHGPLVIGVILSGSLDDGASGLAAIRDRGGVGIVQDPEEALYPSMPLSAIQAAGADYRVRAAQIAPLIEEVVKARKEPIMRADPEPDALEAKAREMRDLQHGETIADDQRQGLPAAFGCPDCGGSLWQLEGNGILSFRCRVGHAYTPRILLEAQGTNVETGLWQAARALEEQAALAERLAARSRREAHVESAERFDAQAARAREHAELVKGLLSVEPAVDALDAEHGGGTMEGASPHDEARAARAG